MGITGKESTDSHLSDAELSTAEQEEEKKAMMDWLSWNSYLISKAGDILIPLHHGPVISSTTY